MSEVSTFNCSCLQTTPTFWDIKTLVLPFGLLVYGFAVYVTYRLHDWNQKSIALSKQLLKFVGTDKEREDTTARIKGEREKRDALLLILRLFFLGSFVLSIIFSYYVPIAYDYFLIPWSVGTTVFSNLVLFPALFWKKAQDEFLAFQREDNNEIVSNNQVEAELEEVEKAEEESIAGRGDENLDAKLNSILQKIEELYLLIKNNGSEDEKN